MSLALILGSRCTAFIADQHDLLSPTVNDGTKNLNLHPTAARLLEAGVHQVVS